MTLRYPMLLLVLGMLFVSCLITANIIAVKLLVFPFGLVPAGILVFPVSYAINDIVSEVWGFRLMRHLIACGFVGNALAVGAILVAEMWPAPSFWQLQGAYDSILGFSLRLLIASLCAYLVGQTLNSLVFVRLKQATNGRHLWLRAIGSTAVGEACDTMLFLGVAFTGVLPLPVLVSAMLMQWGIKVVYEIAATPLTYALLALLRRRKDGVISISAGTRGVF